MVGLGQSAQHKGVCQAGVQYLREKACSRYRIRPGLATIEIDLWFVIVGLVLILYHTIFLGRRSVSVPQKMKWGEDFGRSMAGT